MKKIILFAAFFAFTTYQAAAQTKVGQATQASTAVKKSKSNLDKEVEHWDKLLTLTDAQKKSAKAIFEKYNTEATEIKYQNKSDAHEKIDVVNNKKNEDFRKILTKEQAVKFDEQLNIGK